MASKRSGIQQKALFVAASGLAIACATSARATVIAPDTLLIATTTYQDQGDVANLAVGSLLPGKTAGSTSHAVSDGSLNTVWNNTSVNPAFSVTSAITLQDVSVKGPTAQVLNSLTVNPSLAATSFASKSELGLNITQTKNGPVATFMGYAGAGVGRLDVSNSDSTTYKDTTNPVTTFFAPGANQTYAFNRSVVAVDGNGNVSVTQTGSYGGDNGRAAVLGPNGLYYTVGNSNNGSGTPSQLTTTTGLEVVAPGTSPSGSTNNAAMINPTFTSIAGDKAGKDANFRGITSYNGQLYFTKGSGSNGINTVYTVSNPGGQLPTTATAGSAAISILPGFPTTSAKTQADFAPFGLFFANSNTLYVADDGLGDSVDATTHAGLQKWSLVNGTWQLDYTLRGSLIGSTYSVNGWNYTEKTVGLRNLAGRVNSDGTVSLFATTAETSTSGDNGADPNEVVLINDLLSATTSLPNGEDFSVFDGPVAGLRYGGLAFSAAVPEPTTWIMMLIGFAGLSFAGYRRTRKRGAALLA